MDVNEIPSVKALREALAAFEEQAGELGWADDAHDVLSKCSEAVISDLVMAAKLVTEGAEVRKSAFEMLELLAVTVFGPLRPGQQYNLPELPAAVASLKERAPAVEIVLATKVNGTDIQRAQQQNKERLEMAALRAANAQGRVRGRMLEDALRAACAKRDEYAAELAQAKAADDVTSNQATKFSELLVSTILALRGLDERPEGSIPLDDAVRLASNLRGCLESVHKVISDAAASLAVEPDERPVLYDMRDDIAMVLADEVPNARDAAQEGVA